jgi:hypothetical protein
VENSELRRFGAQISQVFPRLGHKTKLYFVALVVGLPKARPAAYTLC